VLPAWLTPDDLAFYAGEFERTGFRGGLNWYRCLDRNWELARPWHDVRIEQLALYVAGERDCVRTMAAAGVEHTRTHVPGLVEVIVLPGCGHWTQQERPDAVNDLLLAFLGDLP
jgi:pimeloyl-ACP methyl ester carboxylesterase